MPHFKNQNNELYWLDEGDDPAVWLPNCTLITDAEANSIRAAKEQAAIDAMTYAEKRAAEYPSFADQFDLLYHGGYDAWKAAIDEVKNKYPKE
jgi:hypothetical protein